MTPPLAPLSRPQIKTQLSRASVVFTLLAAFVVASVAQGGTIVNSSSDILARLQWNSRAGTKPYRLQISRDERFNDVMFDGVVNGQEYLVRDLDPGRYYWRVYSANPETRKTSTVGSFEVRASRAGNLSSTRVSNIMASSGWLAATGEISHPISGQLRNGYAADFLGTNSEGTVYALDGVQGVALWIARYRAVTVAGKSMPPARQFVPLIVKPQTGPTLVIVAFEKGLRALESATGREVWRKELEGVVGGLVLDLDGVSGPEVYLTSEKGNKLLQVDPRTGKVVTQTSLEGKPVGPPFLIDTGKLRAMMIPAEGNRIEIRKANGELVRIIKLSADVTTTPLVADTARGFLLVVGTKEGLVAFDPANFQPLGRITIERGDYPKGTLALADLDGDRRSDILIMLTNLGRVAGASLEDGLVKWSAAGFASASSAAFADLNGDGLLDVVLPGDENFAVALSGRDGSRIWDSEEPKPGSRPEKPALRDRSLAIATLSGGRTIVVGTDRSAVGLRAVELSKTARASPVK